MSSFFISYQRDSKKFAQQLRDKIQDAGLTAWMFEKDLRLGDDWKAVIDNAIIECHVVIVVVTQKALESRYVAYEWAFALGKGKRIVPLLREKIDEKEIHPKLNDLQQKRDFIKPTPQDWEQLIEALKELNKQEDIPFAIAFAKQEMDSHDDVQRGKAIFFLKNHPHTASIQALVEGVQNQSPEISMEAGFALAEKTEYKDERAIPGLGKGLDQYEFVGMAIQSLMKMNTANSVAVLAEKFHKLPINDNWRDTIMQAMANMTHRSVIPELRKILISGGTIHLSVVDALGAFKDPQAVPELSQYLERIRNFENREAEIRVVNALEAIGNLEAIRTICEFWIFILNRSSLKDESLWTLVSNTLKRLDPQWVLQELENALDQHGIKMSLQQGMNNRLLEEIRSHLSK